MTGNRSETQRLTIKEVAQRLGVSTATISNAFNRPDQLSAALRERILNECQALGYRSANSATDRSTRNNRQGVVGVVLSDCLSYNLKDPVANQFLTGLTETFDQAQLNLLMLSSRDIDNCYRFRQQEAMVDGFIVYGQPHSAAVQDYLARQRKPLISVDCQIADYPCIQSDNVGGAATIADHALQHNPSQVAVLGLRLIEARHVCRVYDLNELYPEPVSIAVQRLRGYQSAFAKLGRTLPNDTIWHIPSNDETAARQAAREALLSFPRPQLLLCMSDLIALAALKEARALGIQVPDQLKVVGFDGISETYSDQLTLTTVEQCSIEKGRRAGQAFLSARPVQQTVLPTTLRVGESCPYP